MTSTRFVVELPQHNSDREGTLADIRHSLERLMHVSTTVFDKVEERIGQELQRLQGLEGRVVTVQRKIASIASQPSKACTLIAVSQLPSDNITANHESLFADLPIQKL